MGYATLMGDEVPKKIPTMDDDLKLIQDLPERPRTGNGWPTPKFMQEFDKGPLALQTYINTVLIPALVAGNIPFAPTTGVPQTNVQDAINDVQQQVQDSIAGSIPNGTIGPEKLEQSLFNRVFGGLAWMSMGEPTVNDNTDAGFPIGQKWIRPEYDMVNETSTWLTTGCSVAEEAGTVKVTADKSQIAATVRQSFSGIGLEGDRVVITFTLKDIDPEITEVKLDTGTPRAITAGDITETVTLGPGGTMSAAVTATYPSLSVADGSFSMYAVSIVNVTKLGREMPGVRPVYNWPDFIRSLGYFQTAHFGYREYTQVKSGKWARCVFDPMPTEAGGTGIASYAPGDMLYAGADGKLGTLNIPEGNGMLISEGGAPKWANGNDAAQALSLFRSKSGTYTGNGENGRTIDLGVKPIVLFIHRIGGPFVIWEMRETQKELVAWISDNQIVLANGGKCVEKSYYYRNGTNGLLRYQYPGAAYVELNGTKVTFTVVVPDSQVSSRDVYPTTLGNAKDAEYQWTAIY